MKTFLCTAFLAVVATGFTAVSPSSAHPPGRIYAGYGNGPHDYLPHWHRTDTAFGSVYWYGNGLHDYLPHDHTISPWDGVRSYGYTPFGPTRSYNGFPYANGYYGSYPGGYSSPYFYGGYSPYPYGW